MLEQEKTRGGGSQHERKLKERKPTTTSDDDEEPPDQAEGEKIRCLEDLIMAMKETEDGVTLETTYHLQYIADKLRLSYLPQEFKGNLTRPTSEYHHQKQAARQHRRRRYPLKILAPTHSKNLNMRR